MPTRRGLPQISPRLRLTGRTLICDHSYFIIADVGSDRFPGLALDAPPHPEAVLRGCW
jgi:hypothetical protein